MCAISEISSRAREFAHALLTGGYITAEQYPMVYGQIKEQMALAVTAMMAEIRLRVNAIVSERAAVDQITRETMMFIAGRQQEERRRRSRSQQNMIKLRQIAPPETTEVEIRFVGHENGCRKFETRFPAMFVE